MHKILLRYKMAHMSDGTKYHLDNSQECLTYRVAKTRQNLLFSVWGMSNQTKLFKHFRCGTQTNEQPNPHTYQIINQPVHPPQIFEMWHAFLGKLGFIQDFLNPYTHPLPFCSDTVTFLDSPQ